MNLQFLYSFCVCDDDFKIIFNYYSLFCVQIGISPVSPLFQPLQVFLKDLQMPRSNVKFKRLLGEGAFGEVFLSDVNGLNGNVKTEEVAVKQLRCMYNCTCKL